jgi:hypothetical protein
MRKLVAPSRVRLSWLNWWIGLCLTGEPSTSPIVCLNQSSKFRAHNLELSIERKSEMRLTNRIKEAGATGYILLWLLPINSLIL